MEEGSHSLERFRQAYCGQPPWDIGRPQPALTEIAARVEGSILDVGCGTGDNAIYFAQRGHIVYAVDFVEQALEVARSKAEAIDSKPCFLQMDALALQQLPMLFDNVVDCGLFHVFSDDDRPRYVQSLAGVLRKSGRLWLLCFSDAEPPGQGPRRVSQAELREAFSSGWIIHSVVATRFETADHMPPGRFSDGGPHAWLAEIEYVA